MAHRWMGRAALERLVEEEDPSLTLSAATILKDLPSLCRLSDSRADKRPRVESAEECHKELELRHSLQAADADATGALRLPLDAQPSGRKGRRTWNPRAQQDVGSPVQNGRSWALREEANQPRPPVGSTSAPLQRHTWPSRPSRPNPMRLPSRQAPSKRGVRTLLFALGEAFCMSRGDAKWDR